MATRKPLAIIAGKVKHWVTGDKLPYDTLPTGTGANTVAAGDDARLSDAREWSAQTVDQPEAEAGTAVTRRAWTAQRVRQAAAAWWEAVKGALTGPVAINANSASDALRINQLGAGNALVVEDSSSPDSTPFVITGTGNVVVGATAPRNTGVTPAVSIEGAWSSATTMQITRNSADTSPCSFRAVKSRGTTNGALDAIGSSDSILQLAAYGTDGTGHEQATSVVFGADGAVSPGIVPGKIIFYTANSAGVLTEVFRIDSSQVLALTSGKLMLALNAGATKLLQSDADGNASWGPAVGQADAALPTNSDIRAYYGIKGKPSVAPTLVIDFENSYFAIYNAATNSLFVADNWDAFATYLGADLVASRAGEQTYFDALGEMRTAATGTVQCDHDPLTGQRLGPYLGGARTNILLNSDAPATQSVSVTAQAYTLSFYGTGSVTLSGAYNATLSGSGDFPVRSTLAFTPTAGTLTLTVSGTVQKFQLEAGSDASPYIPTVGASVTRPASHFRIVGTRFANMYRAGAGTVVIDAQANSTASFYASISDGTNVERIAITTGSGAGGNVNAVVTTGLVLQAQPIITTVPTARHRIALSYAKDAVSLSVDGSTPITDTSALVPTAMTMLIIGAYSNLNGSLGGNVRYVALYPSAINAQEASK